MNYSRYDGPRPSVPNASRMNSYYPPSFDNSYVQMPPIDYSMSRQFPNQRFQNNHSFRQNDSFYDYNCENQTDEPLHHYYQQQNYEHMPIKPHYSAPHTSKWSFRSSGSSGATNRTPNMEFNLTNEGPRPHTREGPCLHTREGPRLHTREGPHPNAREGPRPYLQQHKTAERQPRNQPDNPSLYNRALSNPIKKPHKPILQQKPNNLRSYRLSNDDNKIEQTQLSTQYSLTQGGSIQSSQKKETKFLSVNVHGVRLWAQNMKNCNFIFEIFGVLNARPSEVTGGKAFVLKDNQTRTIKCVFYETDRKMITMKRGLIYRCVGIFDKSKEQLQCISIRETTNEEVQADKRMVAMTCNYIRQSRTSS